MLLSLIIPTYNESLNIPILLERISVCLKDFNKEVIVVDDNSPDKTWEIARSLESKYPWLRVIRRMNDKGLSSAVIAGFEVAEGDILAVMDSDLQHDEQILPKFYAAFEKGADIVVGSRKVDGGGIEDWNAKRKFVSWVATIMAKIALPNKVSDPMSGFFAIKRKIFLENRGIINPRGFKILLEYLARSKNVNIAEIGYTFKGRIHGESKLSSKVIIDYIFALYELSIGNFIPTRFIKYGIIGLSGLFVSSIVIFLIQNYSKFFAVSLGIELSILTNFFLNNYWTFKDLKLIGFINIFRGLITFHAICLGGALINQAIAIQFSSQNYLEMNLYVANAFGYFIAAIWNYIINVNITWKGRKING